MPRQSGPEAFWVSEMPPLSCQLHSPPLPPVISALPACKPSTEWRECPTRHCGVALCTECQAELVNTLAINCVAQCLSSSCPPLSLPLPFFSETRCVAYDESQLAGEAVERSLAAALSPARRIGRARQRHIHYLNRTRSVPPSLPLSTLINSRNPRAAAALGAGGVAEAAPTDHLRGGPGVGPGVCWRPRYSPNLDALAPGANAIRTACYSGPVRGI